MQVGLDYYPLKRLWDHVLQVVGRGRTGLRGEEAVPRSTTEGMGVEETWWKSCWEGRRSNMFSSSLLPMLASIFHCHSVSAHWVSGAKANLRTKNAESIGRERQVWSQLWLAHSVAHLPSWCCEWVGKSWKTSQTKPRLRWTLGNERGGGKGGKYSLCRRY